MNQEDVNDLLWKGTPDWRKRQILKAKGVDADFARKAMIAMKDAVEWIEDDRFGENYISEDWYWQMKELLKTVKAA